MTLIRVITVRLPDGEHRALINEAFQKRTSLNQLCIAKLKQPIDPALVPPAGLHKPPQGAGVKE